MKKLIDWIEITFSDGKIFRIPANYLANFAFLENKISEGNRIKYVTDILTSKEKLIEIAEKLEWNQIALYAVQIQKQTPTNYFQEWKSNIKNIIESEIEITEDIKEVESEEKKIEEESNQDNVEKFLKSDDRKNMLESIKKNNMKLIEENLIYNNQKKYKEVDYYNLITKKMEKRKIEIVNNEIVNVV